MGKTFKPNDCENCPHNRGFKKTQTSMPCGYSFCCFERIRQEREDKENGTTRNKE